MKPLRVTVEGIDNEGNPTNFKYVGTVSNVNQYGFVVTDHLGYTKTFCADGYRYTVDAKTGASVPYGGCRVRASDVKRIYNSDK